MRTDAAALCSLATFVVALPVAQATDYYASPTGSGSTCSEAAPCSLNTAAGKPAAGDTVYLLSGTYTGLRPSKSGTSTAWITFAAAPGALPVIEGGNVGSGTIQYVRYVGIVAQNGSSGGFGNGWTDGSCTTMSNGNIEYINCIADGNAINGIAHYCAGGLRIKQSIVLHNGNKDPSWSSGVNLFAVQGGASSNIVEQTLSFENIDISTNHTDGSGFIADQNSQGATFVNNIGFRNGGSCIRITNSSNTQIINNTCVNNGQDPSAKYHDEIFFSDTSKTHTGALLRNNLCIPTSGQAGLTMGTGVTAQNNLFTGTVSQIVAATGALDFHLASGATAIDAAATGSPTPTDEIGFDWKCIKQQTGQAVSWWAYAVDYDYVKQIGGVAKCFASGTRTGTPDVGAYEFNATAAGGTASTGGAPSAGGTPNSGGTQSAGGVPATAGASSVGGSATAGAKATGGVSSAGGVTSRGGATNTGGTPTVGGAVGSGGAVATFGGTGTATGGATSQNIQGGNVGTGGSTMVASRGGNMSATGGASTVALSGGAGNTSGTTSSGGSASPADAGGCSCRVAGHGSRPNSGMGLGILGVAMLRLLRRRKRG